MFLDVKRKVGVWTKVDLSEPETIGQHPNSPIQSCFQTPLENQVTLDVTVTGKEVDNGEDPKHAEVLLFCSVLNCPFHTDSHPKN